MPRLPAGAQAGSAAAALDKAAGAFGEAFEPKGEVKRC
jgi:hypothetical protein